MLVYGWVLLDCGADRIVHFLILVVCKIHLFVSVQAGVFALFGLFAGPCPCRGWLC